MPLGGKSFACNFFAVVANDCKKLSIITDTRHNNNNYYIGRHFTHFKPSAITFSGTCFKSLCHDAGMKCKHIHTFLKHNVRNHILFLLLAGVEYDDITIVYKQTSVKRPAVCL